MPRLRSGDVVGIRGERWRVVRLVHHESATIVEAAPCRAGTPSTCSQRAEFLLPFELIDRLPQHDSPRVVRPQRWRRVARRALADATPSCTSLRAALRADLAIVPFQLEPALALVRGEACRFLIADAVGLGKTIQAGLMISEIVNRQPDARILIVCPSALRPQWNDELRQRFHLTPAVLDAAGAARLGAGLPPGFNPWFLSPIAVTSIDFVKRPEVMRSLESLVWDLAVFDEAHNLAGRSDRAAAAAVLGNRARCVLLLTATPHSGDDVQFNRLCSIGNLNGAYPLLLFRRTRQDAGIILRRRSTLLHVRPTAQEQSMHAALMTYARLVRAQSAHAGARLAAAVLLRRACSSATSLVRSVERRLAFLSDDSSQWPGTQINLPFGDAAMDDEEPAAVLGIPGLRDAGDELAHLSRVLGLARLAAIAESKLHALRRLVRKTREPAIIFTEYRDTLLQVASALEDADVVQLHGGLTPRERRDALRRFTDGQARLMLATDAASEGLNLHHRCRLVVNLELPWTPLRLEQRVGRVDRIGQHRIVHALHFVAAGTCEGEVLEGLVRRLARTHAAIAATTPPVTEEQVAESVLTGAAIRCDTPHPVTRVAIRQVDLGREARDEAERIVKAKALLVGCTNDSFDRAGVMTRLPRRAIATPQCFWMFRVLFTSAMEQVVWEACVPLTGRLVSKRIRSPGDVRSILDPRQPQLTDAVALETARRRQALTETLRRLTAIWIHRERDIVTSIRTRHARLSADLVQQALFDRRGERAAAFQTELLNDALARTHARLSELAAYEHISPEIRELIFALAVD